MQVLEPSLVLQTSRFFGLGGLYMFASTFASTVKGSLLHIARLHSLMRGFRVRTGGRITSDPVRKAPRSLSSTYSVNELPARAFFLPCKCWQRPIRVFECRPPPRSHQTAAVDPVT